VEIKLPATLTARVEHERDPSPYDHCDKHQITLLFGDHEVCRWDVPDDDRFSVYEREVEDDMQLFVARKLAALFALIEHSEDTP